MTFQDFRNAHPARAARTEVIRNCDQKRKVNRSHGVGCIENHPLPNNEISEELPRALDSKAVRHVFVVARDGVPYINEKAPHSQTLESKRITHTNLTGCAAVDVDDDCDNSCVCDPAHTGGELWFMSDQKVLVGGDSGRYGARMSEGDDVQKVLADLVQCFLHAGYEVGSLGVDAQSGKPATLLLGDVQWQRKE